MSTAWKVSVAAAFAGVLVVLGAADGLLTRSALLLPEQAQAGVPKQTGPDVAALARARGIMVLDSNEEQLLSTVLPPGTPMESHVLLLNNDRIATVAWVDDPDVRRWLLRLKVSLQASFSPGLRDLIDERQTEPERPPRDILSFIDPAIRSDRVVVLRVRQRLYEFHVVEGKEREVNTLVDVLSN